MKVKPDVYDRIADWIDIPKRGQAVNIAAAVLAPCGSAALGLTGALFCNWAIFRSFECAGIPLPPAVRALLIAPSTFFGIYYCGIRGLRLGGRMIERIEQHYPPTKTHRARRT